MSYIKRHGMACSLNKLVDSKVVIKLLFIKEVFFLFVWFNPFTFITGKAIRLVMGRRERRERIRDLT